MNVLLFPSVTVIFLQFPLAFSLLLTSSLLQKVSPWSVLVPSRQKVEIHCYISLQAPMTNQYHISMKQVYFKSIFTKDLTYPIFL